MSSHLTFKALEHQGWDERAASYDNYTARITSFGVGPLLEAADIAPRLEVLDVCCGTGMVSAAMIEHGASVTGIDISAEMIAMVERKGLRGHFRTADAEALPFSDETFDRVVCNFGLYHLPQPDRAIAEAARVLRVGGLYAFTTWCGPDISPFFRVISDAVESEGTMDVGLPSGPPPFRLADRSESERIMSDAGFTSLGFGEVQSVLRWPLGDIINFLEQGTVRVTMILRAQRHDARTRIEQKTRESLKDFSQDGVINMTLPALVVSGSKR